MKFIATYLLLALSAFASDTPIDLLILIEKAKHKPVPVAPIKVASGKVEWKSYSSARDSFMSFSMDSPLVIVFGMPGCDPCMRLKAAIEKERIGGVHYAYVDVIDEPEVATKVGIANPTTVPQAVVMYYRDRQIWKQHLGNGEASPANVIKAIQNACGIEAKAVSTKATTWSWRIVHVPAPPGYEFVDIAGDAYYHVTGHHGQYLRAVISKVDIRGMSRRDLLSLHSLIHSELPVGHWEGTVFVFEIP
jgi:glutaredoxin